MLTFAHQAHGGLLNEAIVSAFILPMRSITTELNAHIGPLGSRRPATQTVAWAHILSMNEITAELDARIGPSGAWRAAAQGYRAGLHTFNSMSRITTELNARIGPSGSWRPAAQDCCAGLHAFNEQDHYRAKCSHRPIGHTVGCCTRLSCGPTYFQ